MAITLLLNLIMSMEISVVLTAIFITIFATKAVSSAIRRIGAKSVRIIIILGRMIVLGVIIVVLGIT